MACNIEQIVTLGLCPDDEQSLSGFQLINAAGISSKILADIANETYVQGSKLALQKKNTAIKKVKNDFIGVLQANNVVTTITDPIFYAADFNISKDMGTYPGYRGLTLYKNGSYRGSLRQTLIKSISVYPLQSGAATLKLIVEKNGYVNEYSWDVSLVAHQVNTFSEDEIEELPFIIPNEAKSVRVLIDQTSINFCSSKIECKKGCDGSLPNECGWIDGWTGSGPIKDEGYGVNIEFYCHCNYEQILCDLAPSFSGELIYLKWQIEIFDEQYKTNRFNNWVIYNRDDIQKVILPDLISQYNTKWNQLMDGTLSILKTYRDDCLNCRGVRWVSNI